MKKITLIGYMASGKTTVGEALAKKLNTLFIDLDEYIATKENLSISDIFELKGEEHFRKTELKYLQELLEQDSFFILSLGGGTPTIESAMAIINKNSTCIYLNASVSTLVQRLLPDPVERPILSSITEDLLESYIKGHLEERLKYYEKASLSVRVDNLSVSAIVTEINQLIFS